MRKYMLFLCLNIVLVYCSLHAQEYNKKIIQSGESLANKSYFLYPAFANATIKFKNGGSLVARMNFNLLICEMMFMDSSNNMLVIKQPADIDTIFLNNSEFFFNDGYYQVVAFSSSAKLVVLRKAQYEPVKNGALGLPNESGTGTQTYTSINSYLGERKLIVNEDVQITDEIAYYLINRNNETIKADKQGFIKIFPGQENKIQTCLKQNKIRFNKETDLKSLFIYCAGE